MSDTFDVVVIGGGPGGYVAAIRSAQLGLTTAIIEKDKSFGGTCLQRGCIPTKSMLHHAAFYAKVANQADSMGVHVDNVRFDYGTILKKRDQVVQRMSMGINGLLRKNNITIFKGVGTLKDEHTILVDNQEIQAKNIILASGSEPVVLPFTPIQAPQVVTSRELLQLTDPPKSLTVLGAGAVGLEFACVYHDLGVPVQVIEMQDRPLPLEDAEVSAEFKKVYTNKGIPIHTDTALKNIRIEGNKVHLFVEQNGEELEWNTDCLLVAVGRKPVTRELNLEAIGIEPERGFIPVNEFCQTKKSHIYAIGDIINTPLLAHVASAEGILAAEHIAQHNPQPIDYNRIPSATYSHPEVASIGLTEAQAVEQGYDVKTGHFPWMALGKAVIIGETDGFVKIVSESKYGEVLGVHIIGPHATDLIGEACALMACEGTVEELFHTVHAHPTLAEGMMEAAHGVFDNPIHLPPPRKKK